MKKLLFVLLFIPLPALANPFFKYKTNCYLETQEGYQFDVCTVVETREKGGALKTRNIYSNRFGLTIKGRFDPKQGYLTWDSHNKFIYKWEYKTGNIPESTEPHTYVMPGILVENISWD